MAKKRREPTTIDTADALRAWWEKNVGEFDPYAEGVAESWPRWKLELWLTLHRDWRRRAVAEKERMDRGRRKRKPPRHSELIQAAADALATRHRYDSAEALFWRLPDEVEVVWRDDERVYSDDRPASDDPDDPGGIAKATFCRHYVGRARKHRDSK